MTRWGFWHAGKELDPTAVRGRVNIVLFGRPGNFLFYLACNWSSVRLGDSTAFVEVAARNMRGNSRIAIYPFDVVN